MKAAAFRNRLYAERIKRRSNIIDPLTPRKKVRRREEDLIQQAYIAWTKYHPILRDYIHSIPNGGYRYLMEAVNLKKSGQRKGVLDLFIAYPSQGLHGLYIETKLADMKKSKPTPEQIEWILRMRAIGFGAEVAYGLEKLKEISLSYLEGKPFTQGNNWL